MKKFLIDLFVNFAVNVVLGLFNRLIEWLSTYPWHTLLS